MVITRLDFEDVLLETVIWAIFLENFRMCFFNVKQYLGHIPGMVGSNDVKRKGSALVGYWVQYVTLILDHTHDLDLGVSRSESEIALSQEWGGLLTWNEKDLSHQFMTMILTSVTMVWWADVQDSDRSDFRRRVPSTYLVL